MADTVAKTWLVNNQTNPNLLAARQAAQRYLAKNPTAPHVVIYEAVEYVRRLQPATEVVSIPQHMGDYSPTKYSTDSQS